MFQCIYYVHSLLPSIYDCVLHYVEIVFVQYSSGNYYLQLSVIDQLFCLIMTKYNVHNSNLIKE